MALGAVAAGGARRACWACERRDVRADAVRRGPGRRSRRSRARWRRWPTLNSIPAPEDPADIESPPASEVFVNVKVLNDLSATEFSRLMQAFSTWVSPEEGCDFCHNPDKLESDEKYPKVVARRMIEMTRRHQHRLEAACRRDRRHLLDLPSRPGRAERRLVQRQGTDGNDPLHGQPRRPDSAAGGNGRRLVAAERPAGAVPDHRRNEIRVQSTTALPTREAPAMQERRVDLLADDVHVRFARRELHLLPQHACAGALGREHAAARDRVARHPHGARAQHRLPDAARRRSSRRTASARTATARRSVARPATRAPSSRSTASAR